MNTVEFNKQAIFTIVATHLLTQAKRSKKSGGSMCMYRAPDGCKCAVGVLIDDKHYKERLEGSSLHDLDVRDAVEGSLGIHFDQHPGLFGMLTSMQRIHDGWAPSRWKSELRTLAKKHELLMPEVPA